MSDKLITVDGLPVEVDDLEYNKNADAVIEQVRAARAALTLQDESLAAEYVDFDAKCEPDPDCDPEDIEDGDEIVEGDEEADL